MGHPPPHKTTKKMPYTRPDSDYIRYVASLEHGKSRHHHHIHMLLWCREIPSWWKADPNMGRRPHLCNNTQCWPLKSFWKYGGCKPDYFRTKNDIWYEHGFVMPTKVKKVAPTGKAGYYLTKYMTKDHKEWKHRMKATRGFGLENLRNLLHRLPPTTVEALTWRAKHHKSLHFLSTTHSVPLGLLRSEAKRMHSFNTFLSARQDTKDSLKIRPKPFNDMLQSVKAGARPDRMDSREFYDWLCQHLAEEKGFCEVKQAVAHLELQHYYPPWQRRHKTNPVVLTGT